MTVEARRAMVSARLTFEGIVNTMVMVHRGDGQWRGDIHSFVSTRGE
jgi:hypothetical protein